MYVTYICRQTIMQKESKYWAHYNNNTTTLFHPIFYRTEIFHISSSILGNNANKTEIQNFRALRTQQSYRSTYNTKKETENRAYSQSQALWLYVDKQHDGYNQAVQEQE